MSTALDRVTAIVHTIAGEVAGLDPALLCRAEITVRAYGGGGYTDLPGTFVDPELSLPDALIQYGHLVFKAMFAFIRGDLTPVTVSLIAHLDRTQLEFHDAPPYRVLVTRHINLTTMAGIDWTTLGIVAVQFLASEKTEEGDHDGRPGPR